MVPEGGVADLDPSALKAVLDQSDAFDSVIGQAPAGSRPPLVAAWPMAPQRVGIGLAQESIGIVLDVWQLNAFAETAGQAIALRNLVLGLDWPDGWELVEIGPVLPDTAPAPLGYMAVMEWKYTPQRAL